MNTIAKAIAYLKEPQELEATLKQGLLTADLQVPNIFVGANTVKYQHIEFGDYDLGNFDPNEGYDSKDILLTWKEMQLTQDKGDSLKIDRMDDEEACANGIVTFANRYILKVQAPEVDKYRFGKIRAAANAFVKLQTLTAENILQTVLNAKARLEDRRINTDALILYITPANKALLKAAALEKGYWQVGSWNDQIEADVEMFDGCKVTPIPSSIMGDGEIQFILLHKNAAPAFVKYAETEFFEKIPGFGGRRMQADIGLYHDAFVYDELQKAIFICKKTANTTYTVTYDKVDESATGTAPTQAATAPDGEFALKANPFTLTGKTFAGWSDGYDRYREGDTYVMPARNVTLTAIWK